MNERLKRFLDLIHQDVESRRLRTALTRIKAFAREQNLKETYSEAETIESRYYYMLRSMIQGIPDPEQTTETAKMLDSVLILGERAYRQASMPQSDTLRDSYARYASIRSQSENIPSLAVDFLTEQAAILSDPRALMDASRRAPLERLSRDIFHRIWVEYPLDEDSYDAILNLISERDIPSADRESWLNAVTLGLLEGYDPRRFRLLAEISHLDETSLRAAALSGLFFGFLVFHRQNGSPELNTIRSHLSANQDFAEDMRTVVYEYARQMGTDTLAARVERDILPRLNSLGAAMMQKLGGIDLSGKTPEEINDILAGATLSSDTGDNSARHSIRNLNELTEKGDDVFFSFLKAMHQQPFFGDIANWWLPFDTSRSEFAEIFDGEGAVLGELFGKLDFLCDSDKYAVLMAVAASPQSMRAQSLRMMVDQFGMIADQMPETDASYDARFRRAVSNYMKNAFRFYRLFRRKGEFPNPFRPMTGLNSTPAISELYSTYDDTLNLAERLFKSDIKPFAFPFYLGVIEAQMPENANMLMNAAASAEAAGYLKYAADWLRTVCELNPTDERPLVELIRLLKDSNHDEEILPLLDKAGEAEIENPDILKTYATALADAHRYNEAQNILDKIIYLGGNDDAVNAKLLKAEIHLRDGNALAAMDIIEDLTEEARTTESTGAEAFRILGTALLASHEADKAFAAYRRSLGQSPDNESYKCLDEYIDRIRDMIKSVYNLSDEEINGMLDAVRYSISSNGTAFAG